MRPKVEWAIDSEAMRARGIIFLVKSNYLVKNFEKKQLWLAKRDFGFQSWRFSLLVVHFSLIGGNLTAQSTERGIGRGIQIPET